MLEKGIDFNNDDGDDEEYANDEDIDLWIVKYLSVIKVLNFNIL